MAVKEAIRCKHCSRPIRRCLLHGKRIDESRSDLCTGWVHEGSQGRQMDGDAACDHWQTGATLAEAEPSEDDSE